MRTPILAALLIFALPLGAAAQPGGSLAGTITNAEGAPLSGMNVYLEATTLGAATRADGSFRIDAVPAGSYTLVASGVGYRQQRQPVTVRAGTTTEADFVFDEAHVILPEIEVLGRRQSGYASDYTFAATRTATAPLDAPLALSTATKELLADRHVFGLAEATKNLGAVHQNAAVNDIAVRGFRNHTGPSASGYRLINGLRAGFGYFTNPLLVNVERVEVLKGPGAMLFGAINPGGTVNLVTKKPLPERRTAVHFGAGSFNTLRTAVDLTGPLTSGRTLLYRLNVGYETTDTFRDFNDHTSVAVAPTVTFVPSERTTLNAELVYTYFDGFLNRGLAVPAQDLDAADISRALNQPSDWYNVEDVYLNASLTHRLRDDLTLNAAYLRYGWREDLAEHRTLNRWVDDGVQLVSAIRYWERLDATQTDHASAYLTLRRNTRRLHHTVLVGADLIHFYTDGGTVWEARMRRVPTEREITTGTGETVTVTEIVERPLTFDLRNPVYRHRGNDISTYVFRKNRDVGDREDEYRTLGVYVQDQIDFAPGLSALLGVRYEFYRDVHDFELPDDAGAQDQRIVLPRVALRARVAESVNVYGHFTRGFTPVGPLFIHQPELFRPDGRTDPYEHETSRLAEVGVKSAFFGRRLGATLALFQIVKANVIEKTGEVNGQGNEVLAQLGKVESRGAELELSGQVRPGLDVHAHYTYNPTEVVETNETAQEGLPLWGAPRHLGGLWAKYVARRGRLEGLGAGLGLYHASERRHRFASADLQTRERFFAAWPAYTLVDAALYYQRDQFKASLTAGNLFDTRYWTGGFDFLHAYPGTPRHALLSLGYTF